MNIKLLEKSDDKASFVLEGCKVSFANSLRRSVIEEVPTLAVEDVEFRENSSALYDEIIAHRLGLLPIKTDLKSYTPYDVCECEGAGCAKCQLKLTLKEKGPKMVYASDIKSKDPKATPVYPKTPIVKLLKNHELECEMTAVVGRGKEHVKWSPGHVYYKHVPEIKISKKGEKKLECIEVCPHDIFVEKKGKLAIDKDKVMDCTLCGACEDLTKGEVKVEKQEESFVFYVESWGQLEPQEIMKTSSELLRDKLRTFVSELKATN